MDKRHHDEHFKYAKDWGFYDPLMAGSIDGTDEKAHDRGIERALHSTYRPNKKIDGVANCTLFIGRLNYDTNEETLRKHFIKYGDIKHIRLVRDLITGFSKGYAFIEYEKERDAQRANRDANRIVIDEREIIVEFEMERKLPGWIPRRLGGGFGGCKESGQLRFGGRYKPFGNAFLSDDYQKTKIKSRSNDGYRKY